MYSPLLPALLLLGASAAPASSEGSYEVDEEKVYHGSADSFKSPATVDRDKVFAEITAYKQIEKEALNEKHPRYWILLEKANSVFKKVVEKVATDNSYDLIAENESVKWKGKGKSKKTPPEVTQEAIDAIKDIEKDS